VRAIYPERIETLLVRGTNWVGDAVMSVPALKKIRSKFSNAHIALLVRPWVKDVYAASDFVDEILVYDQAGSHRGLTGMRHLVHELKSRKFDMAVLLQNAFEAAWIAFWARIPIRLGYARDGRSPLLTHPISIDPTVHRVHQAYYYLGILSGAGLLTEQPWKQKGYRMDSIRLGVCESDERAARDLLRARGVAGDAPIIGINPGASYGGAKRWPAERFASVADALATEFGARIVIVGAPRELPIAQQVADTMVSPCVVLAGMTTLGQLMGLIKECRLFITNDSGPMHLAAALGVPQLAIFGSTSETATGPLSASAQVIKYQVDCNPCFLRECPTDFRCMLGISVYEVVAAARARMSLSAVRSDASD
jgi:heptosyltransferase-2